MTLHVNEAFLLCKFPFNTIMRENSTYLKCICILNAWQGRMFLSTERESQARVVRGNSVTNSGELLSTKRNGIFTRGTVIKISAKQIVKYSTWEVSVACGRNN